MNRTKEGQSVQISGTLPVFTYQGNKNQKIQVGQINGSIYTSRRTDKHFFRIFQGFGLGIDVYNFLIENKVSIIQLEHQNQTYQSDISQWKHTSRWDNEILLTEKIDPQYILDIKEMEIIGTQNYDKGGNNKMAEDSFFSKQIGNEEAKTSLDAKPVLVLGKVAEPVLGKAGSKNAGKEVGKKLTLIVKHPDREEPVKISSMIFVTGKTIKTSTMWINLDSKGDIQKGSHIAMLLEKYQVKTVNELEGKTLQTELDENKFLAIKVY